MNRRFSFLLTAIALASSQIAAAQDPDFLVEIQPSTPAFFFGDFIKITALWSDLLVGGNLRIEILRGDTVVRSYPLIVQMPGRAERDGRRYLTASLGLRIDYQLAPGVYRARGTSGGRNSRVSESFTIEPWGTPADGVQVSLAGPASVAAGSPIVVTVELRNTKDPTVLVPSSEQPSECAAPWLTFIISNPAIGPSGPSLRDDRKDCRHQPMVLLHRGERISFPADLSHLNEHGYEPRHPFRPASGRIGVHLAIKGSYYTADLNRASVWTGTAISNPITIDVK